MAGWSRSLSAVALGSLLVIGMAAPVAAGPPRSGVTDVTHTAAGQRHLDVALERRAARGQRAVREDLRVLRFGRDAYLVVPRSLSVTGASILRDGSGRQRVQVDIAIRAGPVVDGRSGISAQAAGPAWQWAGGDCFDALSSAFGYSVSCYELDRVISDGSATRDYWALEHWSTTGPDFNGGITANAKIYDAWVSSAPAAGSAAMSWVDWAPRGDKNGQCQPIGVTVNVLKLPLTGTYEMCEQWDMTWYAEGGRFRNQWKCGCFFPFGVSGDREVAYTVAVWVPNGTFPRWTLSQGFLAW